MRYAAVCDTTGNVLYEYETNADITEGPEGTTLIGLVGGSLLGSYSFTPQGWTEIETPDSLIFVSHEQIWQRFNDLDNSPIEVSGLAYCAGFDAISRLNHIHQSWGLLNRESIQWPAVSGAVKTFTEHEFSAFVAEVNQTKALRTMHLQSIALQLLNRDNLSVSELMDDSNWLD